MKKHNLWFFFLVVVVFSFKLGCSQGPTTTDTTSPAPVHYSKEAIKKGHEIHLGFWVNYPELDSFYKIPDLWGGLTRQPQAAISVPMPAWQEMTDQDRNSLAAYVSSLVPEVKESPLYYGRIPYNAPAADRIKYNAQKYMTPNSWIIFAGAVSEDGRDIMIDKTVMAGGP